MQRLSYKRQLRSTLTSVLAELKGEVDGQETRVRALEVTVGRQEICLTAVKGDVGVLKLRSAVWDGLNSVAAVVAGLIGMARGAGSP